MPAKNVVRNTFEMAFKMLWNDTHRLLFKALKILSAIDWQSFHSSLGI